ncbi:MAG: 2OG-Fe(II) oxygenase [Rhodospirillales bacterium]|nr:2OG-Fe(II) oxygenase [Rhodospirillales bacterium]
MEYLDLAAMDATPVASVPFTHIVVEKFVRPERLGAVIAALPPIGKRGSFPLGSLRLGPAAAGMFGELEGPGFRDAVARKFGLDLAGAPVMTTLRGQSSERDGRIHCDSTAKRVTVLVYLNEAKDAWTRHDGCLRLLRGPGDIEDFAVEVPPVNGTLLVFPNGPTTWHGHRRHVGPRYVAQLNYMTADAAARRELRRHRFSAFLKRLAPAA